MRTTHLPAALLLGLVAAGCSDNDYSGDRYFCAGFFPNATVTSTTSAACSGCSVTNLPAAVDGSIDSFATVVVGGAQGQGVTIRATAPNGTVYPANVYPGALVGLSDAARAQLSFTITTYLAGTMQETSAPTTVTGVMGDDGEHPSAYYGFVNGMTFDSVQVQITNGSTTSTTAQTVRLHGVCDNGGPLY